CAVDIAAAVNPDNNGETAGGGVVPCSELRCEDVEVKAVFVHARRTGEHTERRRLRTDVAETSCIPRLIPLRNRLGRHPTQLAHRRRSIRNTAEFINTIPKKTCDRPLHCVYNRSRPAVGRSYGSTGCCRQ